MTKKHNISEDTYIDVTNLTKARIVKEVLGHILPDGKSVKSSQVRKVAQVTQSWIDKLEEKVVI